MASEAEPAKPVIDVEILTKLVGDSQVEKLSAPLAKRAQ